MKRPSSLADFVGDCRASGNQINYQCCPECSSTSWKTYLNPMTGMWYCFAADHNRGGKVDVGLAATSPGREVLKGLMSPPRVGVRDWSEAILPPFEQLSQRALTYLASRGISAAQAADLGIVEQVDCLRVLFPYFGPYGRIIYYTARAYSQLEEGPKYLTAPGRHPLYILPRWEAAPVRIVVEGVLDAIAIHQHLGLPVAALGGKTLPHYLRADLLRLATDHVVVMLDEDAAAFSFRLKGELSDRRKVSMVMLPRGEDPSSMGERLLKLPNLRALKENGQGAPRQDTN